MRSVSCWALVACGCEDGKLGQLRGELNVEPNELDLGTLAGPEIATQTLTLSNSGDAPIHIASIRVDEDELAAFSLGTFDIAPLEPSERRSIRVFYRGAAANDIASLAISSERERVN